MSRDVTGATTCYMAQQPRGVAYDFWLRLENERVANNWAQVELARRAGVPTSTINRLRNSARPPYASTVNSLAEAAGIDLKEAHRLAGLIPADEREAQRAAEELDDFEGQIQAIRDSDLPRLAKDAVIREAQKLLDRQIAERVALEQRQAEEREQIQTWINIARGANGPAPA